MMDLPLNILIGNGISFFAGIFIILSCWVNDVKKAYLYQFLNAFILTISSVFFFSWTGFTTLLIASIRNAMVYYGRLTKNWTILFLIITIILGLAVNTMGFIGLLPIIAVTQLTVSNFYLKSIKYIKTSFIVDSLIYVIYFLAILDFTSAVVESITVSIGMISLIRLIKSERV